MPPAPGGADITLTLLTRHDFPGNVRELENIIEHAFVLCPAGMIEPSHLPEELLSSAPGRAAIKGPMTLNDLERLYILEALARNQWNRLATARELGIHKSTLFRKIKSLGIELPEKDGRSRSIPE